MTAIDREHAFQADLDLDDGRIDSDYLITDQDYGDPFEGL